MTSSDFRTHRMLDLGLMNEPLKSVFINITCFTTFESLFLALFSWILCRLDFFQKSFASVGFVASSGATLNQLHLLMESSNDPLFSIRVPFDCLILFFSQKLVQLTRCGPILTSFEIDNFVTKITFARLLIFVRLSPILHNSHLVD